MAFLRRKQTSTGPIWYVGWREGGRGASVRYLRVGPDRREAVRQKTRIEARLLDQRTGGPVLDRLTFGEFARTWLEARPAFVRPKTLALDRHLLGGHLLPAFGARALVGITAADVSTWAAKLVASGRVATAARAWQLLSAILEDAVRSHALAENPLRHAQKPRMRSGRRTRFLSVDDFCRLLITVPERWRPVVLTFGLTGLRWSELVALRWEDVDLDGGAHGCGRIHVRRAIPANTRTEAEPKSRAGWRTIDLHEPMRQALLDLPQRNTLVFPAARGGPLNHRWFARQVWHPAVTAVGLYADARDPERLRVHDLRHFYASLLIAWGETPLYVASQLGHSSPAITLAVYGHLMREGRRLEKKESLSTVVESFRHAKNITTASSQGAVGQAHDTGGLPTPDRSGETGCDPAPADGHHHPGVAGA